MQTHWLQPLTSLLMAVGAFAAWPLEAQVPSSAASAPPVNAASFGAACQEGNLPVVEQALAQGLEPLKSRKPSELCPFFQAVQYGQYDVIRRLLLAGVPVNAADAGGRTALSVACDGMAGPKGNNEAVKWIVRLLIRHGADVNAHGGVALTAASTYSFSFLKDLVEAGGKPKISDLIHAVKRDDLPMADFLIEKGGDPQPAFQNGLPLMLEVKSLPMLERVAKLGFDFKAPEYQRGYVLYTRPVAPEMFDKFLELGFDVNGANAAGRTALHLINSIQGRAVDWLLSHGAQVNAKDSDGVTPMMVAATGPDGSEFVVRELMEQGGDPLLTDNAGLNVLEQCITTGRWPAVLVLLQAQLRPRDPVLAVQRLFTDSLEGNTKDLLLRRLVKAMLPLLPSMQDIKVGGQPLLVCSAFLNDTALAENLILAGADINGVDNLGRTPLMWAEILGASRLKQTLVENGANQGILDAQGKTAVDHAKDREQRGAPYLLKNSVDDGSAKGGGAGDEVSALDSFQAIALGNTNQLKRIIETSPASLLEWRAGLRPIQLATALGHTEMVALLHKKGSSLTDTDAFGRTLMYLAVVGNHPTLVGWLLDNVSKTIHDDSFKRAATMALKTGCSAVLFELSQRGWKPKSIEETYEAVSIAVEDKDLQFLRVLLPPAACPLEAFEPEHDWKRVVYSLLSKAVEADDPEVLKLVVTAFPQALHPDLKPYFQTAFVHAVESDRARLIPIFLDVLNLDPNESWTPGLIPNINLMGKQGLLDDEYKFRSRLGDAVVHGNIDTIKMLLASGASVKASWNDDESLMLSATKRGDASIIRLLMEHSADVNETGRPQRVTPLMTAVEANRHDLVELLLAGGADLDVRNRTGQSALDLAKELVLDRMARNLEESQKRLQQE